MEPRPPSHHARIPTLDGWRGIAIIMVLFAHYQDQYTYHFFFNSNFFELGQHGVNIFFVLSGFLITTGLISNSRSNLKLFYARRFFRIAPASLSYLLFLYLLAHFTGLKAIKSDLWGCLFFYRNYMGEHVSNTFTTHFWSLSLEEQFYFVWPILFVLLVNNGRRIMAASVGALSIAIFRWIMWDYYSFGLRALHTEVRADPLIIGCLLALALQYTFIREVFVRYGANAFAVCSVLLLVDIYRFHSLIPLHESLLIAVLIGSTTINPEMIVGRVLEMEHLKMIGVMSYSVYLWQGVFLRPNWGPLGFVLLGIAAFSSWAFIERPGVAFGKKITRKWRSPSLELLHPVPVADIA